MKSKIKSNLLFISFTSFFLFVLDIAWRMDLGMDMRLLVFLIILYINSIFILEIKEFIFREASITDSLFEFFSVALTGLSNIGLFAYVYYVYGVESSSGVIVGDFITSLYFSIVTWTTLGYGDLTPTSGLRLVASLEALLGYVYMAILIGLFLNLLQSKKSKNS